MNAHLILATSLLATTLAGCQRVAPTTAAATTPVMLQVAVLECLNDSVTLDGVVAPVQQATLVARVPGTLEAIHFRDGQQVKRGQLLFSIEAATYREQLQLNLAQLEQARADYTRQLDLALENATSQASVEAALSTLRQREASVQLAKINLGYTAIRAPFDGVMGRRQLDVGNYVGATPGASVLATIMQISPVYVTAAVAERSVLSNNLGNSMGNNVGNNVSASLRTALPPEGALKGALKAEARVQGATSGEMGEVDFIDHQIGADSGSLTVRARFANRSGRLLPGAYASLRVGSGGTRNAIVVPAAIVFNDQQGDYLFVVDAHQVAHRRAVRTAVLPAERKEVLSGVTAGEQLVVSGYAQLRDGQSVRPTTLNKGV